MDTGMIEQYCRVCLDVPDIPPRLRQAYQTLQESPEDFAKGLKLAATLWDSSAFRACVNLLDLVDVQTPDQMGAKELLLELCGLELGLEQNHERRPTHLDKIDPSGEHVSEILNMVYRKSAAFYIHGHFQKSRDIYNAVLPHDFRLHAVNAGTLGKEGTKVEVLDSDIEQLRSRLIAASETGHPVSDARPPSAALLDDITPEDIASLKGRRILLILRENYFESSDSRKSEIKKHFCASTETLGMDVSFFSANPFIHYASGDKGARIRALTDLVKLIQETKPEFVVFENLCAQPGDTLLTPEHYAETLARLRSAFNFKLIAMYPDAWSPESIFGLSCAEAFADTIWHLSYSSHLKFNEAIQKKSAVVPFPYSFTFGDSQPERDLGATFMGAAQAYNFLRPLWFMAIEDGHIPFKLILTQPIKQPGRLTLTNQEYAALLRRIRISVQFSARDVTTKILCGRVWESILAGCALLEEDNIETRQLLVPYLHYIPFNSIHDLAVAVACLEKYPEEREALAQQGFDWGTRVLDPGKLWAHVLLKA